MKRKIENWNSLYIGELFRIIEVRPTKRKHDSGYPCFDVRGVTLDKKVIQITQYSDHIAFGDCLLKSNLSIWMDMIWEGFWLWKRPVYRFWIPDYGNLYMRDSMPLSSIQFMPLPWVEHLDHMGKQTVTEYERWCGKKAPLISRETD